MSSFCSLASDDVHQVDCIEGMGLLHDGSVDLVFADPPFNIGYEYDTYDDRRDADAYLKWTKEWGRQVVRVLKPDGAFWLAIGDEYAAEMKILFHRELGLYIRNWIVWYYTFGVHCTKKFTRSHAHILYFVKNPKSFTFNDELIRVPSARQLVYSDSRANPMGRIPDDTWVLRPQDLPEGFTADCDTWYFSRVCGTFKERVGWHGCQMPERLLGRIIEACSNAGELVLDPFSGSGTTLAVAKKLGRRYLGFEISSDYVNKTRQRLDSIMVGQDLVGSNAPYSSGKRTPSAGRQLHLPLALAPQRRADLEKGIIEAFQATRDGFSVDRVIADPDINERFLEMCVRLGLPGGAVSWNHTLMNMRKSSALAGYTSVRPTTFPKDDVDQYSFACEIAAQTLENKGLKLDRVLCDPVAALEFDRIVVSLVHESVAESLTPLKMRWRALGIRKKMKARFVNYALRLRNAVGPECFGPRMPLFERPSIPSREGLYLLEAESQILYVGETRDLNRRLLQQSSAEHFDFWNHPRENIRFSYSPVPAGEPEKYREASQSLLIGRLAPIGNYSGLALSPPCSI